MVVQRGQGRFEAVPEHQTAIRRQVLRRRGSTGAHRKICVPLQVDEECADERDQEDMGGEFILEREACQAGQWLPK